MIASYHHVYEENHTSRSVTQMESGLIEILRQVKPNKGILKSERSVEPQNDVLSKKLQSFIDSIKEASGEGKSSKNSEEQTLLESSKQVNLNVPIHSSRNSLNSQGSSAEDILALMESNRLDKQVPEVCKESTPVAENKEEEKPEKLKPSPLAISVVNAGKYYDDTTEIVRILKSSSRKIFGNDNTKGYIASNGFIDLRLEKSTIETKVELVNLAKMKKIEDLVLDYQKNQFKKSITSTSNDDGLYTTIKLFIKKVVDQFGNVIAEEVCHTENMKNDKPLFVWPKRLRRHNLLNIKTTKFQKKKKSRELKRKLMKRNRAGRKILAEMNQKKKAKILDAYSKFTRKLARKALQQMRSGKVSKLYFGLLRNLKFRYSSLLLHRRKSLVKYIKHLHSVSRTWNYRKFENSKELHEASKNMIEYKKSARTLLNQKEYNIERRPPLNSRKIKELIMQMKYQSRFPHFKIVPWNSKQFCKLKFRNTNTYLPEDLFYEKDDDDVVDDDDIIMGEEEEEHPVEVVDQKEEPSDKDAAESPPDVGDNDEKDEKNTKSVNFLIDNDEDDDETEDDVDHNEIVEDYFPSDESDPEYADKDQDIPEEKKRANAFWERRSHFSTFNVKGLPGLLFLSRLVSERVGEHSEAGIAFIGPGLKNYKSTVKISPIRRLMLLSLGLPMADRYRKSDVNLAETDGMKSWFSTVFQSMCYGRGRLLARLLSRIHRFCGIPKTKYQQMDGIMQSWIITKLHKKMCSIKSGKEDILLSKIMKESIDQSMFDNIGSKSDLDVDEFKYKNAPEIETHPDAEFLPWSEKMWLTACNQFIAYAKKKQHVEQETIACALMMKMIFLNGYTENIFKDILPLNISTVDKVLFIINLAPCDRIYDNMVSLFERVEGLDRLPFVGLGYHRDCLQVLKEEAIITGDCQVTSHLLTIGKCLDRAHQSEKKQNVDSELSNDRDVGGLLEQLLNSKTTKDNEHPTLHELHPFSYLEPRDRQGRLMSCENLARQLECEVSKYMTVLDLFNGGAYLDDTLNQCERLTRTPNVLPLEVSCDSCHTPVMKGVHLAEHGHQITIATNPIADQLYQEATSVTSKTSKWNIDEEEEILPYVTPASALDPSKNEEELEELPSVHSCQKCRRPLPRCTICSLHYLTVDAEKKERDNSSIRSMFSFCFLCNHGGHMEHLIDWFDNEIECPVFDCKCRCMSVRSHCLTKENLTESMVQSSNMRARAHVCNPTCGYSSSEEDT